MTDKILTLLGFASKAGKIVFGTNGCMISIKRNKIKLIILAGDIASNSEEKILGTCKKFNVPYVKIFDRDILSEAVGKTNKTIIGITDDNFSKKIMEYCNVK